jgi:hypothetical protein
MKVSTTFLLLIVSSAASLAEVHQGEVNPNCSKYECQFFCAILAHKDPDLSVDLDPNIRCSSELKVKVSLFQLTMVMEKSVLSSVVSSFCNSWK